MKDGKVLTQRMVQKINYENSPCNKDCKERCPGCQKSCEKLLFFNLFEKIEWNPKEHVYYGASKHDDYGRKEARKNRKKENKEYMMSGEMEWTRVGLNS